MDCWKSSSGSSASDGCSCTRREMQSLRHALYGYSENAPTCGCGAMRRLAPSPSIPLPSREREEIRCRAVLSGSAAVAVFGVRSFQYPFDSQTALMLQLPERAFGPSPSRHFRWVEITDEQQRSVHYFPDCQLPRPSVDELVPNSRLSTAGYTRSRLGARCCLSLCRSPDTSRRNKTRRFPVLT